MNMMKKFLFIAAALLGAAALGSAQQLQQLPNDPATRVGKLDNGLTYYIRHNEKPAQRAEFYLATDVGAIQELPDQDGLAHFLEHMCFNGTKNFPGKGILNWLESIGASFGGNVNASTGVVNVLRKLQKWNAQSRVKLFLLLLMSRLPATFRLQKWFLKRLNVLLNTNAML